MNQSRKSLPRRLFFLAMLGALGTLVLGTREWMIYGKSFSDALYYSFMAFGLSETYRDIGDLDRPMLHIVRWLGFVTALLLAAWAVLLAVGDMIIRLRARASRRIGLVIGGHPLAEAIAEFASQRGKCVLHLGADGFNKSGKLTTLPWEDIDRKGDFIREYGVGATHAFIMEKSDAETLQHAMDLHLLEPHARIFALVSDHLSASAWLDRLEVATFTVESLPRLAIRAHHITHPPFLDEGQKFRPQLAALIVGTGPLAEAVIWDLAVNCVVSAHALPRISLVGSGADGLIRALNTHVPEIGQTCAIEPFSEQTAETGLGAAVNSLVSRGPGAVYICLEDEDESLRTLERVRAQLRNLNAATTPIHVWLSAAANAFSRVDAGVNPQNRTMDPVPEDGIIPFGTFGGAFGRMIAEFAFGEHPADATARDYHYQYLRSTPPMGGPSGRKAAVEEWARLKETYRISNRSVVKHIPAKLAFAGVDPTLWRGKPDLPKLPQDISLVTEDLHPKLAELEHVRWNAERRWNGWRHGVVRDNANRVHPDLVDFAALDSDTQKYDFDSIRTLDKALHENKPRGEKAGK